jgi:uncharacterized membrane protein YGL010W
MKSIDTWLTEYGASHQNHTNKLIHWICVPLIVFSLIGMLWSIPTGALTAWAPASIAPFINFGTFFLALSVIYYAVLSRTLFLGMVVVATLVTLGNYQLAQLSTPLWLISLAIFVAAWIGQFIGHKIEGKKPSFFEDLQFLMIGPAWCMSFLFRKVGIPV